MSFCVERNIRNGKEVFLSWCLSTPVPPPVSIGITGFSLIHRLNIECIRSSTLFPLLLHTSGLFFSFTKMRILCFPEILVFVPHPRCFFLLTSNIHTSTSEKEFVFQIIRLVILLYTSDDVTPCSVASHCCSKEDPFQGPKLDSCLTLRNELSEETHVLTKQETVLGMGTWVESSRVREPRRTALPHGLQSYGDGIIFQDVLANHSDSRVLFGGARLVWPRWMPERRILGGDWTSGVSFWPSMNSSGWWRLISSLFLTRTSCHKTAHADGYYGAWPGWAVSISVLPLTPLPERYFLSSLVWCTRSFTIW